MDFSFAHIWASMGIVAKGVVFVLLAMSFIALSFGVERLFALVFPRGRARRFAARAQDELAKGNFDAALKVDAEGGSAVSRVVGAGVRHYLDVREAAPSPREVVDSVQATLDRAVDEEVQGLRRGLGALATIGSTAPFVGLFGTVVGIVNSFADMARLGGGRLEVVSAGIAEALVTTALGIVVAVPAVMLYNYFAGQVESVEASLVDASSVLVELVRRATWTKPGNDA